MTTLGENEKLEENVKKPEDFRFHPFVSGIQKMALYETKARFYLVGSNNTQTRFRVLKIDRTEPKNLVVVDDLMEYSHQEVRDLLSMIDVGNRPRQRNNLGFTRAVSAFGIVGFVKFMEGYYIVLITKRRRIALVGHHTIYKIEETSMVYIPNESVRIAHPDEARYVKLFQSVDLSSNFYFSYSYDLTHTLQYNLTPPAELRRRSQNNGEEVRISDIPARDWGIQTAPHRKFVWNDYLLRSVEHLLHSDWLLYIVHGFLGQSNISVFGKPIYLTLIARRSNRYAGTRFLKRGANNQGDVANEIETEQILHESCVSSWFQGRYTSYVQMRGSIPAHWSQDVSKMVPKPTIAIDTSDPFAQTPGLHFLQLMKRYGAPVIALNLVKKREKKRQESILSDEYLTSIQYLNQFLPPAHHIQYIGFDMARLNKLKEANVMARLADIASVSIRRTGLFQSQGPLFCHSHTLSPQLHHKDMEELFSHSLPQIKAASLDPTSSEPDRWPRRQTGIIRVNCVDCLDRTNTAQFAIGKCALAYQLFALGIIDDPQLEFDSDCVRMLEELYEDHGDTLALQYGGSQLVHRIQTYRRTAPWTSQGNDIMQTLSRYYSNTFSDADKQNAMNLFLGVFVPDQHKTPIWELPNDYLLHHPLELIKNPRSYTQWWDENVVKFLPLPLSEVEKRCVSLTPLPLQDIRIDGYYEYYRPYEFTILSDLFAYTISHSVRDFMPNFTTNFSPFSVRIRPGKRREEMSGKSKGNLFMKNPSLTGHSSTGSTASSTSTESDDSQDEENGYVVLKRDTSAGSKDEKKQLTFQQLFPPMSETYGVEIATPNRNDMRLYRRYANVAEQSSPDALSGLASKGLRLVQRSLISLDNTTSVAMPAVKKASLDLYANYVNLGLRKPLQPSVRDLSLYKSYASQA